MEMDNKHKSKLHKGFNKMVIRQDAKESEVVINLPIAIKLPKRFKGEYIHSITVANSKWNGMNLKNLRNSFQQTMPGWFNSNRTVTKEGKYKLSIRGKQYLNRKRAKIKIAV